MTWMELQPLWLEMILAVGAMVLLGVGLLFDRPVAGRPGPVAAARELPVAEGAALLCGLGLCASFFLPGDGAIGAAYLGSAWTVYFKRVLLATATLAILGGRDFVAQRLRGRQGEYYFLLLLSLLGMMLLPGARDLIFLVVCFELMGVPLYVLAAYLRDPVPGDPRGAGEARRGELRATSEAGLKLYLVGASSTAVILYGVSLLYGLGGSTHLADLATHAPSALQGVALLMVLAGMGFKIGAVPFHMWVPDTYQGASTPLVTFLSVAPKAAGVAAVVVLFGAVAPGGELWHSAVLGLSVLTMTVGNLMALPQRNIKRLLGYSGVAQMGYVLVGVAAGGAYGLQMVLFYLAGYAVTNVGVFLVVHAVTDSEGDDSLEAFAGLARRSPFLGMALLVFLLSLAGIPFVVGFWAKLYVFMAAWQAGLGWLVGLGAVLAVVGLFYYLQVARSAYMVEPRREGPVVVGVLLRGAILLCLLAVVGMGLWPGPFVDAAAQAAQALIR